MITNRKSDEKGHENYGWLDTRHTFSFGDYHDPDHRGCVSPAEFEKDYRA